MRPTWGPPGSCRPQMGLMLALWTLLWRVFIPYQQLPGYPGHSECWVINRGSASHSYMWFFIHMYSAFNTFSLIRRYQSRWQMGSCWILSCLKVFHLRSPNKQQHQNENDKNDGNLDLNSNWWNPSAEILFCFLGMLRFLGKIIFKHSKYQLHQL